MYIIVFLVFQLLHDNHIANNTINIGHGWWLSLEFLMSLKVLLGGG